jgi:ArsR family transcriptional regulator
MDLAMHDFIQILKALADETRFRIINLLLTHDFCVGALAGQLNISKAAVSQHLQILRKAGLVRGEKRGYWTHYIVDKTVIHQIAEDLIERTNQVPDFRMGCYRSVSDEIKTNGMERPEECTPEQIRECHGDEKDHPDMPKKEGK